MSHSEPSSRSGTSSARRGLLKALLGAGVLASLRGAAEAGPAKRTPAPPVPPAGATRASGATGDQTAHLQRLVDEAALSGTPVVLPAGVTLARGLRLRPGTVLRGAGPRSVLKLAGDGPLLVGEDAGDVRIEHLRLEGGTGSPSALVHLVRCRGLRIEGVTLAGSAGNGLTLERCSGRIGASTIGHVARAGLLSLDAEGLDIEGNTLSDCADNGILVWRSSPGEDGSRVADNRIERIGAASGGSGQNGNGVNVFRASGVLVTGNRIADCAYSAVRANAASNVQIVANRCQRIGEVALYAEFAFEGALIAQNLVDGAAAGISVTNFNEGGRLAVIQGNIVRNLVRREHEAVDKRGEGISVEADAAVTGNTIEGAPTAGIVIGWGRYMRDVAATGNLVRRAGVGIMVTRHPEAGAALIAQNLIAGTRSGAIRLMDEGRLSGPDLALTPPAGGRLVVAANVVAA
jgi:uncharacterized secreted repeat protein (TIGR03808 family)